MATLPFHDQTGASAGTIELTSEAFNTEPHVDLMHRVVVAQLAKKRSGTAHTKDRSLVAGSTRKLYRQKGTGRARRGAITAPLLRGGGTVFGPKPRSYEMRIPKKMRRKALASALSVAIGDGKVFVVQAFGMEAPRTKTLKSFAESIDRPSQGMLIITADDEADFLAVRRSNDNLPGGKTLKAIGVNVHDVLKATTVILTEAAAQSIEKRYEGYGKSA